MHVQVAQGVVNSTKISVLMMPVVLVVKVILFNVLYQLEPQEEIEDSSLKKEDNLKGF